ncbi:putative NAD(P)/FAD-binding protein YdhS [Sinorhizobium fredii]
MRKFAPVPVVAIIGGGFSGAAVALHLTRILGAERRVRIVVFEPRARLGAGLAYDTAEPAHRINVPAFKMTLYPDEPEDFAEYLIRADILAADPGACSAGGTAYPRRSVFGDYVAAELAPRLASGAIEHRHKRVRKVTRSKGRWTLRSEDGEAFVADIVVLAVTHPAPSLPKALLPLSSSPRVVADSTRADALDGIAQTDRVLIVGNGLTAADVVAALAERGHRGPIVSISRHGLRSRGHPVDAQEPLWRLRLRPDHPRIRTASPHPPDAADRPATGTELAPRYRCGAGTGPADLAGLADRRAASDRPVGARLLGRASFPHSAAGRNRAGSGGRERPA